MRLTERLGRKICTRSRRTRWCEGTSAVLARQVSARMIVAGEPAGSEPVPGFRPGCVRVISGPVGIVRLAWLADWAAQAGHRVVRVEAEVGSQVKGSRPTVRRCAGCWRTRR